MTGLRYLFTHSEINILLNRIFFLEQEYSLRAHDILMKIDPVYTRMYHNMNNRRRRGSQDLDYAADCWIHLQYMRWMSLINKR